MALIRQHIGDDASSIALMLSKRNDVDRDLVVTQIAGLQTLRKKIPSWYGLSGIIVPPHLPLEQSSSELTATYKASLCGGDSLCDLTGGFGVDFAFMAKNFGKATYIEQQQELCSIMEHNLQVLQLTNSRVINGNSLDLLKAEGNFTWIYADPARRDGAGSKTVLLHHCQPDLTQIYSQLLDRCDFLMVKLSPMLDISLALNTLTHTTHIHVVSVENECKELLLISSKNASCTTRQLHCVNLMANKPAQTTIFTSDEEHNAQCQYTSQPQEYLYEPNASIMKAGVFKAIASRYNLIKLHPQSHLYTSNAHIAEFPGRVFRTAAWFGANKADIKSNLHGISSANISVRNFPASVAELRRKLKLNEGGSCYLFATTMYDEKKVIIRCEKVQ